MRHFKAAEYQALTLLTSAAYKTRKIVLGQFLANFGTLAREILERHTHPEERSSPENGDTLQDCNRLGV